MSRVVILGAGISGHTAAAYARKWLGNHARQQAALHAAEQPIGGQDPRHWWARRALRTARTLQRLRASLATAG